MYTRHITLNLKADSAAEYTKTLETTVLPILRKQPGFKDKLSFVTPNGDNAVAISLWDTKENADLYAREAYAGVLQSLQSMVEGSPLVRTFDVPTSTFHKIGGHI